MSTTSPRSATASSPSTVSRSTPTSLAAAHRAVAAGRAGDAEIDAALAADNTAKGGSSPRRPAPRSRLPRARSAPGRRSSTATRRRTRSCARRRWASSAPTTLALLEPFVEPYFEMLVRIWDVAQLRDRGVPHRRALPVAAREPRARDATRAWLDANPERPRAAPTRRSSTSPASSAPSPCRSATRGTRSRRSSLGAAGVVPRYHRPPPRNRSRDRCASIAASVVSMS